MTKDPDQQIPPPDWDPGQEDPALILEHAQSRGIKRGVAEYLRRKQAQQDPVSDPDPDKVAVDPALRVARKGLEQAEEEHPHECQDDEDPALILEHAQTRAVQRAAARYLAEKQAQQDRDSNS